MANSDKDNLASGEQDKILNEQKNQTASKEEEAIFAEIQSSLKSGSYREKVKKTVEPKKEDDDAVARKEDVDDATWEKIKLEEKARKKEEKKKARKAKKDSYEKTTFMHKIGVLAVLTFLGIFTGSGLGVWYFNVNLRAPTYDQNPADYMGNVNDVFNKISTKYNITFGNSKDWYSAVEGKVTPEDLTPSDNFLLATYNATLADSFLFTGNGSSGSMGINQTVYSLRRYDGKTYTFEAISKGTGKIGMEMANLDVYQKGAKTVDLYTGQKIKQRDADWYYNRTVPTEEYEDMMGGLPSGITPYIISDKTIKSVKSAYDEQNEYYVYTYELDPVTSILTYYREMKRTGSLEGNPKFESVKYIMTIDKEWNLVTTEVFETYEAIKFGLKVTCNGTIKIDYVFNPPTVQMPTYKKGK